MTRDYRPDLPHVHCENCGRPVNCTEQHFCFVRVQSFHVREVCDDCLTDALRADYEDARCKPRAKPLPPLMTIEEMEEQARREEEQHETD